MKLSNEIKEINPNVEYVETYDEIYERLLLVARSKDVVFVLGAGTVEKLARRFTNNNLN